jgi:hypothetical protein
MRSDRLFLIAPRRALSGSWDQTLRLWGLETGAALRRFEGQEKHASHGVAHLRLFPKPKAIRLAPADHPAIPAETGVAIAIG